MLSRRRFLRAAAVAAPAAAAGGLVAAPDAMALEALATCTVNRAVGQPVRRFVVTLATWDIERVDTAGFWSTAAPGDFVIPSDGWYLWNLQPTWTPQRDGDKRAWHLQINPGGSTTNAVVVAAHADTSIWNATFPGVWQGRLSAGDVLQLYVYHENPNALDWGGVNRPLASAGQSTNCEMSISKVGL